MHETKDSNAPKRKIQLHGRRKSTSILFGMEAAGIEPASKSCDLGNLHAYSICFRSRFSKVSKLTKPFEKPARLTVRASPQAEDVR
jgi:hypothetical protein